MVSALIAGATIFISEFRGDVTINMNTNQVPYDKNNPEYVSFSQAYVGHIIIQLIFYSIVIFLCWVASLFLEDLNFKIKTMIVMIIVIAIVGEGLVTALERPAVVRARHSAPGGLSYAWPQMVIPPILTVLGCFILFDRFSATVFSAIFLVVLLLSMIFLTPWKQGMSGEDVQKGWDTVKAKYKEEFLKERYKGVEVDPEIKKIFDRKKDL